MKFIQIFLIFISCSCSHYQVIKTDSVNYKSKETINRKKGITKEHYIKMSSNGVIIEKGQRIENTNGTWSTPEYEKITYYDSITGKRLKFVKTWYPTNRKSRK